MQYKVKRYLLELQNAICNELELEDEKATFTTDKWVLNDLGYGTTRLISNGHVFEKGGVNFSHVIGHQLPASATDKRPDLAGQDFEAIGVSLVLHPENPFVPTTHANFRFFTTQSSDKPIWWFGGGFDLTPYYGFEEDCVYWHQKAKEACEPYGDDIYKKYKLACDHYFFLKHRNEPRGIGGIFFDDLNNDFEKSFSFLKSVGDQFIRAYRPIVAKRKHISYTEKQKEFQLYRRGRYVEFNLLYDRGTAFGLQTKGRTESILMSLPPKVAWTYDWKAEKDSEEDKLTTFFLTNKEWVSYTRGDK